MSETSGKMREIDLGENFGDVVVKANGAQVTISADGSLHGLPAPANDMGARATPEIGTIESAGEHKGEIYGGIYPADNKPIWFSAAPKVMDHYAATAWASGQGGSLPTRNQGDYLTTLKGKLEICPAHPASRDNLLSSALPCAGPDGGGAFTEIFNRGNSIPAGYVWLAEPSTYDSYLAWCQRLSDGSQYDNDRLYQLPVLCCVR